jgi:hypothetical protein
MITRYAFIYGTPAKRSGLFDTLEGCVEYGKYYNRRNGYSDVTYIMIKQWWIFKMTIVIGSR